MVRRLVCALLVAGCGAPAAPPSTGGTDRDAGRCGRGLVVVQTDYQSSNVSLLGLDGAVLSSSFLSSASADPGLSAALSGDVVPPTAIADGDEVVLIDRYPASVLTFVRIADGTVRAQLDVGTGFAANPQDYLRLADDKAYVSRFETNTSPGDEPFDAGGDLLIVDPRAPAVVGRVDLSEAVADAPGFLPRPNRMLARGRRVYLLASAYDAGFADSAPSRLAIVDAGADRIDALIVLDGFHGCAAMALSGEALAIGCSGKFADGRATGEGAGALRFPLDAGGALGAPSAWTAAALGVEPPGFSIAIAPDGALIFPTLGHFGQAGAPDVSDALVALGPGGEAGEWLRSQAPFTFGDVVCSDPVHDAGDDSGCDACWLADADQGRVHRIVAGAVEARIEVDARIGLPPRTIGRF